MAKDVVINAKVPANEEKGIKEMQGSITVQFTDDVTEAVEMFSAPAVLTNALRNWVVTLQGNIRGALKRGIAPDALQALLGSAKMGVAQVGAAVDPIEAYMATFANATAEKQAEMLKDLKMRAVKD